MAQSPGGEVVISEDNLQRLANKLYELKLERNQTLEAPDFEEGKALENLSTTYRIINDTLVRVEKSSLTEHYKVVENEKFLDSIPYQVQQVETLEDSRFLEENLAFHRLVLEKLEALEAKLERLENDQDPQESVSEDKLAASSEETNTEDYRNQFLQLTAVIAANQAANQSRFSKVNKKLDSIIALNQPLAISNLDSLSASKSDSLSMQRDSIRELKNQLLVLNAQLDSKAEPDSTVITETKIVEVPVEGKTKVVDREEEAFLKRKEKYGSFAEHIYFGNNSIEIDGTYTELISKVIKMLGEEDKIDVSIAGYASKTGTEAYNKELSLKRALALKKLLMSKGISSQRILTDYKGIDDEAETLAEARRLDIEFVVRK